MNKKNLTIGIASAAAIIIVAVVLVFAFKPLKNENEEQTTALEEQIESTYVSETELQTDIFESETIKNNNTKPSKRPSLKPVPVNPSKDEVKPVDGWLKILTVGDYGGKLSFTVQNVSKDDIEYAIIKCSAGSETATFKITALLAGQKARIICNEDIKYDASASYSNWKIENKALFLEKQSLNKDVFEINPSTGSIEIKNISNKNIDSTIFICYKRVEDGVYFAPDTFRVRIDGLGKGETKTVKANRFIKDKYEVIFVDYEK